MEAEESASGSASAESDLACRASALRARRIAIPKGSSKISALGLGSLTIGADLLYCLHHRLFERRGCDGLGNCLWLSGLLAIFCNQSWISTIDTYHEKIKIGDD